MRLAKISIHGVVQGVGFRPFVFQLASRFGLNGWVCNTSSDVKIEVEGDEESIKDFIKALGKEDPPQAHIENILHEFGQIQEYTHFKIRKSLSQATEYQLISPDIATCEDCTKELFDPANRRFRYPFTNCTNCGPRFTIIEDIPYDRQNTTMKEDIPYDRLNTTMKKFKMCPECQREYNDPLNRRFHAQPNACPVCGPQLQLMNNEGKQIQSGDVILTASNLLKSGHILALKGLGGFLLACDASNNDVVIKLRTRKKRPAKPFAVMINSIEEIKNYCFISEEEEKLLKSSQSPIVLLRSRRESQIAYEVAPDLRYLGVMLPYTPLHHLLLNDIRIPLIMTSGNLSEEPIARVNDEALLRLSNIADFFILHDRDIHSSYDDSVSLVEIKPQIVRRARSYAPFPIHLPFKVKQVLGCGAELKNTFCMTRDDYAFIGQHIGDLENLETLQHYETTIDLYKKLFRLEPELVVCDLHPNYLSTRYAENITNNTALKLTYVQHHHAHIASCMAENKVLEPVIGVSLDGTGYGTDGHIWGGEFLIADYKGFKRFGHLEYVPMPGGDVAVQKPYRMALSYLYTLNRNIMVNGLPFMETIEPKEIDVIINQIEKRINSPLTSSCGRLFDAVSAILNLRKTVSYEAQAAIDLEMNVQDQTLYTLPSYPFSITEVDQMQIIRVGNLLGSLVDDIKKKVSIADISARFHKTVGSIILDMCKRTSKESGINKVALSGGVFQNRLLLNTTFTMLKNAGFEVLIHSEVPCNDGGISLGQAVIGNFIDQ
ncbi:MAG: carbamoyltransferase HypF [Chloroflexi bacterium]|nr:carbamoyltransferase HypF [Chloroflexota bacterium]